MALSLSLGFILKPHCQSLNQNQGKNAGCQLANMLLFMFMGKNLSYDKSKLLCTVQLQAATQPVGWVLGSWRQTTEV